MKKIVALGLSIILGIGVLVAPAYGSVPDIPEEEDLIILPDFSRTQQELIDLIKAGKTLELAKTIEEAVNEHNDEVKEALLNASAYSEGFINDNYQLKVADINEDIYWNYGVIVKGYSLASGEPYIDASAEPEVFALQTIDSDGDWRILGRNINNEWVENPFYDPLPNSNIDQRDWLYWDDYTNIQKSVIGPAVTSDGIFCHEEIVEDYYVNFIYGLWDDYKPYLSTEFFSEFYMASYLYTNQFLKKIFSLFNLDAGYYLFNNVGSSGTTNPPLGNTEMGSYVRIVSLPTATSAGVAYLFHEDTAGNIYYLSVFMYDNDLEDIMLEPIAVAEIDAPATITDSSSSTMGTFDFTLFSRSELASYELFDVSSGVNIDSADMSGTIPAGERLYSNSVPITIDVPGATQTINISVRGTDILGNIVDTRATHTVTKSLASSSITSSAMGALGRAVLKSDNRGSEEFDVLQGIPSTEDLYANVYASRYLSEEVYTEITGTITYDVTVERTYNKSWTDPVLGAQSDSDTRTKNYTVTKNYSYYLIDQLDVYGLAGATLNSSVLPGGILNISPSGYSLPVVVTNQYTDHVNDPYPTGIVTLTLSDKSITGTTSEPATPNPDWTTEAEDGTGILEIRNDQVSLDGLIILDDTWAEETAPIPSSIPVALMVHEDVLYESDLTIPANTPNGTYSSTGTVTYERVLSINSLYGPTITENISTINDVIVHTPVVCYPEVESQINKVQLISPDSSLTQLIIGRTFDVYYPTMGQHLNIPGYGDRDYASTTGQRQVLFQFDTYEGTDDTGIYHKANEWIDVNSDYTTFYLPNWVNEEDRINSGFRTLAINLQSLTDPYETSFNDNLSEYKAVEEVPVQISGQVYDFQITGSTDKNWESFFQEDPNDLHAGLNDFLGNPGSQIYTLPLMPGKNDQTGYGDYALKLGYEFSYNFTTNGDMTGGDDVMVIIPTYWHVDEHGLNRQEVDVYFQTENGFSQLGNDQDTLANHMVLNRSHRDITTTELENTARVLEAQMRSNGYGYEDYYSMLAGEYEKNIKYKDTLLLTEYQKTYIGTATTIPAGHSNEDIYESEQKWYGEHVLPGTSIIVPYGTDLGSYEQLVIGQAPFISDGFIIINFEIMAYHDIVNMAALEAELPTIAYDGGYSNQWDVEGYETSQQGMTLFYGDVAFYYVDKSLADDYK